MDGLGLKLPMFSSTASPCWKLVLVCWGSITNYYGLGGLATEMYCLTARETEVQDQGVSRVLVSSEASLLGL